MVPNPDKYVPKSFLDTWHKNVQRNLNYQLRNNDLFYTPLVRFEHLKNIPYFSFPVEWNTLNDIRFQSNKKTFQIALKNSLLEELVPAVPVPPPPTPPPPAPTLAPLTQLCQVTNQPLPIVSSSQSTLPLNC